MSPPEGAGRDPFGWRKVEKVLQAIDAVEVIGIDPADTAPQFRSTVRSLRIMARGAIRITSSSMSF
jgi:hypothetical protein